jgi:predicted Zn-dependent protease
VSAPRDSRPAQLRKAAELFRVGRAAEAEGVLRAVVGAEPTDGEALEMLGVVLGAQGRHADALGAFDRARDARPSSATIRHNRAQALFHLGRRDEARAELQKAVELRADYTPSWNLLGNVLAAAGDI